MKKVRKQIGIFILCFLLVDCSQIVSAFVHHHEKCF